MVTILILICAVIVLVAACYTTWHFAEHHELHKVRAEFDDVLKHLGPSSRFRQGLEKAEQIIDKMDENFFSDYVGTENVE